MFGALQSVSQDVLEAARIDGAGPIRTAFSIKLPLIGKYVAYMVILSFAAALQVFVEPQLFYAITQAGSSWWSLNQLGYTFAFQQGDFGMSAAVSVVLLVLRDDRRGDPHLPNELLPDGGRLLMSRLTLAE